MEYGFLDLQGVSPRFSAIGYNVAEHRRNPTLDLPPPRRAPASFVAIAQASSRRRLFCPRPLLTINGGEPAFCLERLDFRVPDSAL